MGRKPKFSIEVKLKLSNIRRVLLVLKELLMSLEAKVFKEMSIAWI